MDPVQKLAQYFAKFPGIGGRQSKRFVYHLLSADQTYLNDLSKAISNLKKNITQCPSCFIFFEADGKNLCSTCENPKTDRSTLMIVEKDIDAESIKRSGNYKGKYFILGGLIPVVEKDTPKWARVKEVVSAVESQIKNDGLKEIILAFAANPSGEHTDMYMRRLLSPIVEKNNISIASLGRGLSTGSEIEYADSETLKNALKNRQ